MRSKRKKMPQLSADHIALLGAFNDHNVQYLLIGGYAVGVHSKPRTTKDLRVPVISAEKPIANKLAAGKPRDLLDAEEIREAQLAATTQKTRAED